MSDGLIIDLFGEDHAHESLITALVKRVAREESIPVTCQPRSVRGGHPRAIKEFRLYQNFMASGASSIRPPDLIVVTIDSNCTGFATRRREIGDETQREYAHKVVAACPEPHIEKWFLADPISFQTIVGGMPDIGSEKCERDYYKRVLSATVRQCGHPATLGGVEFASELVEEMDIFRAGKANSSLKAFLDDFRAALRRLKS